MSDIHGVKDNFCLDDFLAARRQTIELAHAIKAEISVGMTEEDGQAVIKQALKKHGIIRQWHRPKFRIGTNTTKSFKDESEPGVSLGKDDIFFLDLGPVWGNYEGDYGETFCLGENPEHQALIAAVQQVFTATAKVWQEENRSGAELYDFAASHAESLGYELNPRMKGHRLGDFPHQLFFKGGLSEISEAPIENLWVLEIHILNKSHTYGAFFEDVLIKL